MTRRRLLLIRREQWYNFAQFEIGRAGFAQKRSPCAIATHQGG
jgi:hypothetical protein